ncbi:MAG: hypothetical protein O0X93_06820 [Methanocorpusculum sp.]|nr:hypothetical protein [Methanocorpusculum sp.]MDE2522858.1 hypothetical protein [Methanocorpusculum sp.]MDE2523583.1 hypothetical protein [Methanocorpusculum sp.]
MEGETRKKYPPEKLNFRLGSEYIQNFYNYMDQHGGKQIDFVRSAIDYWMSVDGNPAQMQQQIETIRKELTLREELLESSQKYCEERITYLNRLLEEKDARIRLLQERIEQQDAIIKKLLNTTTQKNEDDHS